jgi:hypothetical protein
VTLAEYAYLYQQATLVDKPSLTVFLMEYGPAAQKENHAVGKLFVVLTTLTFACSVMDVFALPTQSDLGFQQGPLMGMLLIGAAEVLFVLAIIYVFMMRNTFASIPRLEKPWIVLEGGVTLLFLGVLLIFVRDAIGVSFSHLEEFGDGVIAVSAVFILIAMVLMKRAWTVREHE